MNAVRSHLFALAASTFFMLTASPSWARPSMQAPEAADTNTPVVSLKDAQPQNAKAAESDFFEPIWKNKVLARIKFDSSGDERKNDEDRYIFNVNPEGYILGSDVLEFLKPRSLEEFKQVLKAQGYDVSNIDSLYTNYKDQMVKNAGASLDRAIAILALNRIIDNEAMKQKVEIETDSTVLRDRAFYVFKTILTKAAIYTGKISEKEAVKKTIQVDCEADESDDCDGGKRTQTITERVPTQDVSKLFHTDLYPELVKIQQWNEMRLKYSIRTLLVMGAAAAGKIGYETKTITDPKTNKTRELRLPTEDVSQKSEEELYELFKSFAANTPINSIKITWDTVRGGLTAMHDAVNALPDQPLWDKDCASNGAPIATNDGIRIAGFDPVDSPLPVDYAEFRDTIKRRLQPHFACRQNFNTVRWDYRYSVAKDLFQRVAEPLPVTTNFFTGEVVEDNNRPKNPITVSLESLPKDSVLFLDRVTSQMRGEELLWQRMGVWKKIVQREGMNALRAGYSASKDELMKVYEAYKAQAFTLQSMSIKGMKVVLSGPKQKDYHERLVAVLQAKNTEFMKEHPKATAEDFRIERKTYFQVLIDQLHGEFAEAIQNGELKISMKPITYSTLDQTPSVSVVRQTMLSNDMVNLETHAILPFAREVVAGPAPKRVLGFALEVNVSQPETVPFNDPRVQNVLKQVVGAKYEAIAQREAAYNLFRKNDVEFLRSTDLGTSWPHQSNSDRTWANLLFPEQVAAGGKAVTSSLGNPAGWSQTQGVSAEVMQTVLSTRNDRRYVAPSALDP